MKLSFTTLGCPDWTLLQTAERAAEYGFDGIELRIGGDRHVDPTMNASERAEAAAMFRSRGIEIVSVSGYTKFTSDDKATVEDNVKQMRINAELAHDLGASYVRSFIGMVPESLTFDAAVEQVAEALVRSAEEARKLGVSILLETHDDFSSSESLDRVLTAAGRPEGLLVLWDTVHTYHCGERPEQVVQRLGSAIRHTHFKDATESPADAKGRKYKYVLTGEGYIPIRDTVLALQTIGYDGYLSLEWEKMWHPNLEDPSIALPHYVKYMRSLLGSLRG
ncbi:sugar phosphate isomerase/epimerase family protein [Paenibacillus koleovorans]|uniref:sugar phosphate isomerase/epimerase family protein n=1 Tax=Paenibacillus koleovorans TaxID=121608 RepID=UPI000FDC54E2|nr:sugar phosphate isomerase/epimerase family protein [Paenibacillus koleovorans]